MYDETEKPENQDTVLFDDFPAENTGEIDQPIPPVLKNDGQETPKLKKKTQEEKEKDIEKLRPKPNRTTLLVRQITINKDLAILALIIASFSLLGYFFASVQLGFSLDSLKTFLKVLPELVITFIAGLFAVIWKLHTGPGKLVRHLSTKANKKPEEVDNWGRTIYDSEE